MTKTYRVLSWTIVALVMVQAAMIAWAGAGESRFIDDGGVIDKALVEATQAGGEPPFTEVLAFPIHGINGGMVIPAVALVLFGCSFAAKLSRARTYAAVLLVLVIVQGQVGYLMGGLPGIGLFHGANALLILLVAAQAARRPAIAATASQPTRTAEAVHR